MAFRISTATDCENNTSHWIGWFQNNRLEICTITFERDAIGVHRLMLYKVLSWVSQIMRVHSLTMRAASLRPHKNEIRIELKTILPRRWPE